MIAGVVLAAGRSSRMGSPKALLDLDGQPFLARIVAALRDGGCEPVVVVTGPDELPGAREVARLAADAGARSVVNPDPSSEQVESLRIALRSLPTGVDGVVVTPVDAPRASAATVAALIGAAREGAPVVVPTAGGRRGHPILFAGEALVQLLGPLPEGARTVIATHRDRLREVPVDSADVLLDIDTPDDYQRLREGAS